MKRVFIIEDDRDIVELVRYNLANEGFLVTAAHDGVTGLATLKKTPPDILLLDLMLPKLSGLEICREIRRDESLNRLPILMLTARGEEADRVVGLGLGADDYVTKPFSPRELAVRVRTVLRRSAQAPPAAERLELGDLVLDARSRDVELDGRTLQLTAKEFDLLFFLASNPRHVFSRDQLMERVWGYSAALDTGTVTVHIQRLRSKIERDPRRPEHLQTVWGVGYRFVP